MTFFLKNLLLLTSLFSVTSSFFNDPLSYSRNRLGENVHLRKRQFDSVDFLARKRRSDNSGSSFASNSECEKSTSHYNQHKAEAFNKSKSEFSFDDNLEDIILLYVGTESPMLLVLSEDVETSTGLWRSSNSGKDFEQIGTSVLQKQAGLKPDETLILHSNIFEHPKFKDNVLIFGWKLSSERVDSLIFLSDDTAQSFVCYTLKFSVAYSGIEFNFEWHHDNENKMLLNSEDSELFYSDNKGQSWRKIDPDVEVFTFLYAPERNPSDYQNQNSLIYFLKNASPDPYSYDDFYPKYNLVKHDLNKHEQEIMAENVRGFGALGETLYAIIDDETSSTRSLHISRDGGQRWFKANLQRLVNRESYTVLDTQSGMMFLHVGSNTNDGDPFPHQGTLYISDSDMLVFSISLTNHAYVTPSSWSSGPVVDFYRVNGMKGTFITSVYGIEYISSLISFNRGASWTAPIVSGALNCDRCQFLIYNQLAWLFNKNILGNTPLSEVKAPGLILANAYYYERSVSALFESYPDLYISRNGGYSWTKVREGPHLFEILDQGGIIAAVAVQNKLGERLRTNNVSVSFDEGACWLDIPFTDKEVLVVDILSEPTKSSTKLNIWAQVFDQSDSSKWTVFTLDFSSILDKVCDQDEDYNPWVPHSDNGQNGCLLGVKETFRRLKPESFCRNGGSFKGDAVLEKDTCECSQNDWECNFGYFNAIGSDKCEPSTDKKFFEEICNENSHIEKIRFPAYRKVTGDECEGGLSYDQEEHIFTTTELCQDSSGLDYVGGKTQRLKAKEHDHKKEGERGSKMGAQYTFLLVSIGLLFFMVSVASVCYFGRRELTSVTLSYNVLADEHDSVFNNSFQSPARGSFYSVLTSNDVTDHEQSTTANQNNGSADFNLHVGNVNSASNNTNRNGEVLQESDRQHVSNLVSDDEPILA